MFNQALIILSAIFAQIQWLVAKLSGARYDHVTELDTYVNDFFSKYRNNGADDKDDARREAYARNTEQFYDLITDFYEYGWGKSFHFAPRWGSESFEQAMERYEHYVAMLLDLPIEKSADMKGQIKTKREKALKVLDIGCGVGGPMRTIARFFRFKVAITGLNITREHVERAKRYNQKEGVKNCNFIVGDFNAIPRADSFFDAIYDFEATLHSTDRVRTFREIARVLKPGGRYVTAQYCCLANFDKDNAEHVRILTDVDNANGCYALGETTEKTTAALETAGFNVLAYEDVFAEGSSDIRFHEVFESAKGGRFTGTRIGLFLTSIFCYVGELVGLLPKGTYKVQEMLNQAASSFKEAGRLELLTPGMLYVCEKPLAIGAETKGTTAKERKSGRKRNS